MSRSSNRTVQEAIQKRRIIPTRGHNEEHFLLVNHDWFVPVQLLRRLSSMSAENELESLVFPADESFDSHWQFYLEHQAHPPRIRLGLTLLSPRDQCLRADVKLIFLTTHGGQVIKEVQFNDHLFFLSKGEAASAFINDQISPKVILDIEGDLYRDVMTETKDGNYFKTDHCTLLAYVRFVNQIEIQPKIKAFESSRRFTVDWKLTRFHHLIQQINQTRPPMGSDRRLVSDRFQYTHVKGIEGIRTKKWRLLIKSPSIPSTARETPLYLTLKCADMIHRNYGKVEIICKNDHHLLRRFNQTFEDLADNYTIEFFTLDELTPNIYIYRHEFNENHGRYFTTEYLLLTIQIVQLLHPSDAPKRIRRLAEPTVISLNTVGKLQSKNFKQPLKSPSRESGTRSAMKKDRQIFSSLFSRDQKTVSPTRRAISEENMLNDKHRSPIASSWDPFSDESHLNRTLPPITSRIQATSHPSPSPATRVRPVNLPDVQDNFNRSSHSFQPSKQSRFQSQSQSRLLSLERSLPSNDQPSRSNSTNNNNHSVNGSDELPENFTFLTNLFRTGLHSDVTLHNQDRQWNLHKSILSTRSVYFNQLFSSSNETEFDLSTDPDTPSSSILDRIFLFLYTNQYTTSVAAQRNSSVNNTNGHHKLVSRRSHRSSATTASINSTSLETVRSLFDGSIKYGIDALTLLCLQDMCRSQNITSHSAPILLISLHQAVTGPHENEHSNDYLSHIKSFKQSVLRFIQLHSREVLLSNEWKQLEKQYSSLVHDVLEFVVFEKIVE